MVSTDDDNDYDKIWWLVCSDVDVGRWTSSALDLRRERLIAEGGGAGATIILLKKNNQTMKSMTVKVKITILLKRNYQKVKSMTYVLKVKVKIILLKGIIRKWNQWHMSNSESEDQKQQLDAMSEEQQWLFLW